MTDFADFDALCAAIDDGDDGALPLLADWLEEAGDRRADGLRRVGRRRPAEQWGGWGWSAIIHLQGGAIPPREFNTSWVPEGTFGDRTYVTEHSRSAAFLALGEALACGQ